MSFDNNVLAQGRPEAEGRREPDGVAGRASPGAAGWASLPPYRENRLLQEKIMGSVFKKNGKYLRYHEHTTHTGTHRTAEWVEDLQRATVFHTLPPLRLRQDEQLQDAEKLEATETRTVTLTPNAQVRGCAPAEQQNGDKQNG